MRPGANKKSQICLYYSNEFRACRMFLFCMPNTTQGSFYMLVWWMQQNNGMTFLTTVTRLSPPTCWLCVVHKDIVNTSNLFVNWHNKPIVANSVPNNTQWGNLEFLGKKMHLGLLFMQNAHLCVLYLQNNDSNEFGMFSMKLSSQCSRFIYHHIRHCISHRAHDLVWFGNSGNSVNSIIWLFRYCSKNSNVRVHKPHQVALRSWC